MEQENEVYTNIFSTSYKLSDSENDVISSLVDSVLATTTLNPDADVTHVIKEIDYFLYRLFDLSNEDIFTIENTFKK